MRHKIQRAQIIDPCDVIGMAMGEQHRIDMAEINPQRLFAQIRPGIKQKRLPIHLKQCRGS
jgi:hypothetical protein